MSDWEEQKRAEIASLHQAARAAEKAGDTPLASSLLLKLAIEHTDLNTSEAMASLARAQRLPLTSNEQEGALLVGAAEVYARVGHPKLAAWINEQRPRLAAKLGANHPHVIRLQELLTSPTKDVQRLSVSARLRVAVRSVLLRNVALFTEITLDEAVITSQIEHNKLKINPHIFANEETLTLVLVRAWLQCVLLHAYDPQNPENEATLKRLAAPFLESPLRPSRWFPEWLSAIDDPRLHFATPQITKEEAKAFWSTALSFAEPHSRQGPLYDALVSLGYNFGTPRPSNDALLAKAKKIIGGEPEPAPGQPEERFFLMLLLAEQSSTVAEGITAFRWVVKSVDAGVAQIFGNNLMVQMRAKNIQGHIALQIAKDPSLRTFLSGYQSLLGLDRK